MSSSEGHEEGSAGDDPTGGDPAREDHRRAAKVAKAVSKAAKREAKAAARARKKAAKRESKAAKREAKAAARALKDAAKELAKAEAKAAKAVARTKKAEATAAKAEAKLAKRAAKEQVAAAHEVSPVVAHASAVLEEAAALIRRGSGAEEPPALPLGEDAGEPVPVTDHAIGEPGPEAEPQDASPESLPEPASSTAAPAAPQPEPAGPEPASSTPPGAPEPEPAGREPEPAGEPEPGRDDADAAPSNDAADDPVPEVGAHEARAQADESLDETPAAQDASEPADARAPAPELATGGTPAALLAPETPPVISVPSGALVAASIDIGSTSVHLLVGAVDGHRVTPLLDESVFLGLGDRAGSVGYFGDDVRSALVADLERYIAAAREIGASSITIVGTEPMRRAADAGTVVQEVAARTGVAVHVLDHVEEGLLTLVGATGGSPVSGELLLVDIGGGSSEFVVVGSGRAPLTVGLPLGANRLTRELVRSDPPSLREIEALRQGVDAVVGGAPEASPSEIVAVGGTASNLLRLLPATAVDRSLTRRRIAVALAMLTVERSSEAAMRHLIRPERARILPAGAIIVDAILERYRADRLRVSEAGIREGAILAAIRGGPGWRDRLPGLARGWQDGTPG